MLSEEFDNILERRLTLIKEVLSSKGKEYSSGSDRLHNFKRAAVTLNTTVEKALMGMAIKHYISILDMIESDKKYPIAVREEKIGDMINYLILLEGCFVEKDKSE